MAARLEDDRGSAKVSWNLVAMVSSGVLVAAFVERLVHLPRRTRRACFSGTGSR